ncbi:hypothetical protein IFR04_008485 [Cadophora malorum]|uniref:Uncharacterized protein n=1 Tax=Cadophora malorum TaxID=108018 RepID=A0A8H7TGE4_9HELO|nr:hypothetical protein IFR04_008485 [Cadophora malorum]
MRDPAPTLGMGMGMGGGMRQPQGMSTHGGRSMGGGGGMPYMPAQPQISRWGRYTPEGIKELRPGGKAWEA